MLANYLIGLREGLEAVARRRHPHRLPREDRAPRPPPARVGRRRRRGRASRSGSARCSRSGPAASASRRRRRSAASCRSSRSALITWMIFWMARTARYMRGELQAKLDGGDRRRRRRRVRSSPLLAVGREGLETALFLWADAQTTADDGSARCIGALLGLATAFVIGWAFYRGALKLNLRVFFAWTGRDPDRHRGRRARLRRPRPPGGGHPARHQQPRLRRLRDDPAVEHHRDLLKGVFNFSPAMTWLEVDRLGRLHRARSTFLFVAPGLGLRAAARRASPATTRRRRRVGVHRPPDAPPGRVTARPTQPRPPEDR